MLSPPIHGKLDAIDACGPFVRAPPACYTVSATLTISWNVPVSDFSGGWRMRLNFGQALICAFRFTAARRTGPTTSIWMPLSGWKMAEEYPGAPLILMLPIAIFLTRWWIKLSISGQRALFEYTGNYSAFEVQRHARRSSRRCMRVSRACGASAKLHRPFSAPRPPGQSGRKRIKMLERMELIAPS